MQIGILGGTFDPVHFGHLLMAEQALEQAQLDQVWLMPSARPPHKLDAVISSFDRRVEMLEFAIAGLEKQFRVSTVEAEMTGPSYTYATLEKLCTMHPENSWHLIIGQDSLNEFPTWREPAKILTMAQLLVVARPGQETVSPEELVTKIGLPPESQRSIQWVQMPLVEFSSTDLRNRARMGKSLRFQTPHAVAVYIREKKLYLK